MQTPGDITIESPTTEHEDAIHEGRRGTGAVSCSRPLGITMAAMKGEHELRDDPQSQDHPAALHSCLTHSAPPVSARITDMTEFQTNAGSFPWKWCTVELQMEGIGCTRT